MMEGTVELGPPSEARNRSSARRLTATIQSDSSTTRPRSIGAWAGLTAQAAKLASPLLGKFKGKAAESRTLRR